MGYLKFREGDIPAAKKWYGEAVQLDSHSYLANYYFAVMSLQGGDRDHDEAIEASLRAANKLNPAFAPGCDALATFYASRNEKLSEAHLLNVQAVQLEPDNLQYRLNAASVLAQEQQFASAVNVLQAAKRLAKNPVETANVQNRIEQFQRIEAMMDARGQIRSQGATQTVVLTSKTGEGFQWILLRQGRRRTIRRRRWGRGTR
jgi:tetratricopeptide (TPR) repeat protein